MELTRRNDLMASTTSSKFNGLASLRIIMIPGLILLGLLVLPAVGFKLPGDVAGYSVHALAQVAAALLLLGCAPMIWRSAYRHAGENLGEESSVATREMNQQLQEARYQQHRRSKDLDAALKRLKALESDLARNNGQARRNLAIASAVINASDEAIFVTDIHGMIRGMSNPAAQLCGVHRSDAVKSSFDAIVQLADPTAERPEHHPVKRIPLRAVDAPNAAPHLENCLLTDRLGNRLPVLVSSMAITDDEGTAIGAWIRLDREDTGTRKASLPAQLDPVTGLATRDGFSRRLDELQQEARMNSSVHQFLMVAPDNLDFVSDRHGYLAAEQMLWQIADTCRLSTADKGRCFTISAGRIGILLAEADSGRADALADVIHQKLQQTTLNWEKEHIDLPVTIAPVTIDASSPSVSGIIELAEGMIRAGRRSGGNRVHRGMPQVTRKDERFDDRGWADWLQQRLGGGLGHLLSQEIQPLDDSAKPALECYMRIEDSDGVWISPNSFLPALRRCGETSMMDRWVLDQVLKQLENTPSLREDYAYVAINVAAESLQDKVFILQVKERLSRSRSLAGSVRFEISENTATMLARETADFVQAVQESGASVAIDNVRGLGLMQLLSRCAPQSMKLDAALVRASQNDDLAAAQLKWLVESAHLRELRVVACGIEDLAWKDLLQKYGVDDLQGSAINKIGPLVV